MLSPNVNEVSENIAAAFMQFLALRSFAFSTQQIVVSPLSPDPSWLPPLRTRVKNLGALGAKWQQDAPDAITQFYLPFTNYATTFSAFSEQCQKIGDDKALWIDMLTPLQKSLAAARKQSAAAAAAFTDHLGEIKLVEGQLQQSLTKAWSELAREEQEIVDLATAITQLQDRVAQLQDNLTSAEISSGKTYFQTAATISYTLVTTVGAEIPYLSIVSEVYTIGKMAYDLIVTDKQIDDAIDQITALTIKASEAAQAAAMSKAVIQMIDTLNLRVTGLADHLPAIDQMWEAEEAKVTAAIDAIQSGADPAVLFDLVSMPSASAAWNTLAQLSREAVTRQPVIGKPVLIKTGKTPTKTTDETRFAILN